MVNRVAGGAADVATSLLETSLVAVVRTANNDGLVELAHALARGGVRLIEITATVPGALEAVHLISEKAGTEIFVGAGTVLDEATARLAILAGARFIVSPTLDPAIIGISHQYGVPVIPGCLSPTEIANALRLGADAIKLFPGRVATPGFFADVLGPFPSARLMPTGNVDRDTAPQYIKAGAVAVGVGKALVDPKSLASRDWDAITSNAADFRKLVDDAKRARP